MQPRPVSISRHQVPRPPRDAGERADLFVFVIGLCWIGYGSLGLLTHPLVLVVALILAAATVSILLTIGARSAAMFAEPPDMLPALRYRWAGFLLVVIGEIALLNLAAILLQAFDAQRFLIPAISIVVGLHFVPLAWLFARRDLYWLAATMLIGAAITGVAIQLYTPDTKVIPRLEGIANGAMLILIRLRSRSVRRSSRTVEGP